MLKKSSIVALGLILLIAAVLLAESESWPTVEELRKGRLRGSPTAAVSPGEQPQPEATAAVSPAATYTVTNTNDAGPGSLRDAINQANANLGFDNIQFNIPPAGVLHTIFPLTPLPWLLDPAGVTIDGLTQPGGATQGASPPSTLNLSIEIDGILCDITGPLHATRGLVLQSDNDTVQGLIVNNWWNCGIGIQGGPINEYARYCMVRWNIVGMDSAGSVCKGNGREGTYLWSGICITNDPQEGPAFASYNTIQENLSSCNHTEGITVLGPIQPGDVNNNFVLGNYVGTDITGTLDCGNVQEGICLCEGTHHNLVRGNLSSGNDYDGIGLQGYNNVLFPPAPPIQTHSNQIDSNTVGLDANGNPLPNTMAGITIGEYGPSQWGCADKNTIEHNTIAENGWDGVSVWEDDVNNFNADENLITQNSIYDNDSLGIDLQNDGVTPNDPNDPDTGPNQEMNFPDITSASYSGGNTTITGTLSTPNPNTATVEVFRARLDPTGYGEGETYLGSATPDAAGNWTLTTMTLVPGDSVTATATDQNNNTSEFCATVEVTSSPWDCDNNPPPGKTAGGYETESNDNCATADYAACETAYCGDISPASDVDYWVITLPTDTCYCLHVRVFGHDTPGQYAENQGLDPNLTIYANDCTTQLYYNDDYNGTFPDAEGRDAQYDCTDPSNCYQPGTTLYIKIAQSNNTYGPYLLVINCDTCECPVADLDTCEYYKPAYVDYAPAGMPDFDQKQDNWTCPSTGAWSHCGPVALADCFWWFDSKFETSGTPPPAVADNYPLVQNYTGVAGVDDHDTSNVIPFVDSMALYCNTNAGTSCGTSVFDLATGAQNWLNQVGLGSAYNIQVVPIDPVFGFEYIREQVLLSQDVILLIGFWQESGGGYCERRGGHFMTVAGVCPDPADSALCFSDPFYDLNEGDPPGPPPHNADVHNDAQYVSGPHGTMHHDKYYVDSVTCTLTGQPFLLELRNYAANPAWVANFDGQNRFDTLVDPTPPNGNPVHAILEWAVVICPVEEPDTCDYYKQGYLDFCPNGMPDFDQKQDAWTSPFTGNWSWCGPVALADCIWWFDSKFEPNPVDPRPFYPGPGNPPLNDGYPLVSSYDPGSLWDDHDTNNVMPFIQALAPTCNTDVTVPGTMLSDLETGFQNWIAAAGLAGLYSTYVIHGPDFDELRDSILSCQDVILLLGFYELIDGGPDCQWLGGHYVTAAGVCTMDTAICISDPMFDANEGEPPAGTAHGSSDHNDASLVSGPHGSYHHDRYDLQLNIYACPSPAMWMFTNYPNNWADVSVFENENPFDPMPPVTYFGGPIVVLLDAALIICPAVPPPPEPTPGKVKHCFDTLGYRPSMGSPVGTHWHELWPNYCEYWICDSWIDNGDGILSYCDTIDFVHVPSGRKIWEHVELVMPTIMVTFDDAPFDTIFLDGLDPNPLIDPITNPIGSWWHEVYPNYCVIWQITGWVDNGNGYLDYCDTVTIETPDGAEQWTGHVSEGVETDIVTTPLPTPGDEYDHNLDGYIPSMGDPTGTMWHELWPNFCQWWELVEWRDNGDGTLSFCDTIIFKHTELEDSIIWKHIEEVTGTIKATLEIDTFYFDYMCGNPNVEPITDAIGTYWHEILPVFSQRWVCQGWADNGNGYLDSCDWIDLMLIDGPDSGSVVSYHIEGWETDIISTYIEVSGISPGSDLFFTPGPRTFADHFNSSEGGIPLPADFFGPGSDPFDGHIDLTGAPLSATEDLKTTDAIVERLETASVSDCPSSDTIDIEIIALHLVSTSPITVTYNGGMSPELWDVEVCLSQVEPQDTGSMAINRECSEGGTFTSTLPVTSRMIFTRHSDLSTVILDPAGQDVFDASGYWLDTEYENLLSPLGVVKANGGLVDHDCDGTVDAPYPATSNFIASARAVPCDCISAAIRAGKTLTEEEALLASYGVIPTDTTSLVNENAGACCLDDGSCIITTESNCNDVGGDFKGIGTICQGDADGDNVDDACPVVPPSDTAIILDTVYGINPAGKLPAGPDLKFMMRWLYSTGNPVIGFQNGFRVYSPDGATWQPIVLDTVSHGWPTRFDLAFWFSYNSVNGSGADTASVSGVALMGGGIPAPFNSQVWWIETKVFEADTGLHLCVDSSYCPTRGPWIWSTSVTPGGFVPNWTGPHCFEIAACCNHDGMRGDADYNMSINVADPTYLTDYLFFGGPAPPCFEEGNADGLGGINVADPTLLTDYIFFGGAAPASCP